MRHVAHEMFVTARIVVRTTPKALVVTHNGRLC